MKKIFAVLIVSLIACTGVFAQQITKFGVVDTAKVYSAYFRDSSAMKNYESKKSEFQNEINKRVDELQKLRDQKVEAQKSGNSSQAMKLEAEITKKTDFLTEYTNAKNVELESLKKSLQNSDAFYKKLYSVMSNVAESEGLSMILSLQQANGILWYSSSVDITDKVIKALGL